MYFVFSVVNENPLWMCPVSPLPVWHNGLFWSQMFYRQFQSSRHYSACCLCDWDKHLPLFFLESHQWYWTNWVVSVCVENPILYLLGCVITVYSHYCLSVVFLYLFRPSQSHFVSTKRRVALKWLAMPRKSWPRGSRRRCGPKLEPQKCTG